MASFTMLQIDSIISCISVRYNLADLGSATHLSNKKWVTERWGVGDTRYKKLYRVQKICTAYKNLKMKVFIDACAPR